MSALQSVVGHTYVCQILTKLLEQEPRAGSLVFCGPEGVGKNYVAHLFAKAFLGGQVEAKNHPDFLFLTPSSKAGHYQKDQIEEIRAFAQVSAVKAPVKVCVLDQAEQLGEANTNALLKTVEEPAAHVLFIFITPLQKALLPTLLSRSVVLHFSPASEQEVETYLLSLEGVDESQASVIAKSSMGAVGLASRSAQGIEDKASELSFELALALYQSNTLYAVDVCKKVEKAISEQSISVEGVLMRLYQFFKDQFLLSLDSKAPLFFETKREQMLKSKREKSVDLSQVLNFYHEVKKELALNLPLKAVLPYKAW